jgi:hypothetical protein
MHVWMFHRVEQMPAGHIEDRFRLEVDSVPGLLAVLPNWEAREGEISEEDYEALCNSTDEVEIEVLHRDMWSNLEPYAP